MSPPLHPQGGNNLPRIRFFDTAYTRPPPLYLNYHPPPQMPTPLLRRPANGYSQSAHRPPAMVVRQEPLTPPPPPSNSTKDRPDGTESEIDALKTRVRESEAEVASLEGVEDQLCNEKIRVRSLKDHRAKLKKDLKLSEQAMKVLNDKNDELTADMKEFKKQLKSTRSKHQSENVQTQLALLQLEEKLNEAESNAAENLTKLASANELIEHTETKLKSCLQTNEELQRRNNQLLDEVEGLEKKLDSAGAKLQSALCEKEALKTELAATQSTFEAELNECKKKLAAEAAKKAALMHYFEMQHDALKKAQEPLLNLYAQRDHWLSTFASTAIPNSTRTIISDSRQSPSRKRMRRDDLSPLNIEPLVRNSEMDSANPNPDPERPAVEDAVGQQCD